MIKEIEFTLDEWKSTRKNTIELINDLKNEDIDFNLPRPILNTLKKHFQEMIDIQQAYVMAIEKGNMSFDLTSDTYHGEISYIELTNMMKELDESMVNIIARKDHLFTIDWFGDIKTISSHLCSLVAHETFHQGQIVAFYYTLGRAIPELVAEDWALPQTENRN
ncbi:DinB family protein [Breznakia pachnodae]|uniref:Damage-inducible protein DinB n=1 Tax=Breznakia pachnodae TaxID=265178 RepID=A0ABU0E3R8_9FIRM|nr:DinB family protein [Breznakia pachnodae]MDQ0361539.1 putative damage-inducible protein DinB [Breznakia pachnodae]